VVDDFQQSLGVLNLRLRLARIPGELIPFHHVSLAKLSGDRSYPGRDWYRVVVAQEFCVDDWFAARVYYIFLLYRKLSRDR